MILLKICLMKKTAKEKPRLFLHRRGLARHRGELPVLAEQVLHEGAESTHHAVAFTRVLDSHDALMQNVAWTQVEFTAGLVAEVHKCLAGEFAALDGGSVETVLVQSLVVILCL